MPPFPGLYGMATSVAALPSDLQASFNKTQMIYHNSTTHVFPLKTWKVHDHKQGSNLKVPLDLFSPSFPLFSFSISSGLSLISITSKDDWYVRKFRD